MKKIEVIISDEVLDKMKSSVTIQKLSQSDNQFTSVIQRILKGIENGDETVTFELRKKESKMFNTYIANEDLKEKILDLGWIVIKEVWTNCPQSVYDKLQSEYEKG